MASALEVALILVGLSFLPPIIYIVIIRNTERFGREPWSQIAKTFLWGAIAAVIISLILYFIIQFGVDYFQNRYTILPNDPSIQELLLIVAIAPVVEEFAKGLGVLTARRHVNEPEDGIVYGASCGLGFAATENLLYGSTAYFLVSLEASVATLVLRAISSALLHASASAAMGYGIGRSVAFGEKMVVLPYYLLAVIMHAAFNFVAFLSVTYQGAGQETVGLAVLGLAVVFAITAVAVIRRTIRAKEARA